MNNAEEIKLETRFCISPNSPCTLCHRRNIRTVSTTETYLAETDDWVCYDCARGIDPELAEFAYYPGRYRRLDHTPFQYDLKGMCPECGRPADQWLIVDQDHYPDEDEDHPSGVDEDYYRDWDKVWYLVCLRHGVCWWPRCGSFDGWENNPQSRQYAFADFRKRFCVVDACYFWAPEGVDNVVCRLNAWRPLAVKAGNATLAEMTDHACLTRDTDALEAVRQLYIEEFSAEELGLDGAEIFEAPVIQSRNPPRMPAA